MHGFLVLKSEDGKIIATGDQINVAHGDLVHSRLVFHFRDGSIDDEITVFRQGSVFQLISDHHIQKGPSFPKPLDLSVDVASGKVMYREMKDGSQEVKTEQMSLPPDLVNGLVSSIVENFPSSLDEMKVSYLTGAPKPRVVKLSIKPESGDRFRVGGTERSASKFRIHVELGGIAGVVAPVVGKQPSDIEMWVMKGEVPAFLKVRAALYDQGPLWSMELTNPVWPSR